MADGLPRCTVVIPTYNGGYLTAACLDAVLADSPAACRLEIVVVDDGSTDRSNRALARFGSDIKVVQLGVNAGFARACNTGAAAAPDCDYLLFLNNDTLPGHGWVDALVREAENDQDVAAVGAKLLFANDQVQHAGIVIGQDLWPHHLYAGFPADHPAVNRGRRVSAVTAACMLVRRGDFDSLGGFDPAFHNGYEDVDLCLRLGERGRFIRYCPQCVVYHLESVTRWPEGVPQGTETSAALYADRWQAKVMPDDMQHYLADGLIALDYGHYHPYTISASPELAVVRQGVEELSAMDRLLERRSQQVMQLLNSETRRQLQDLVRIEEMTTAAATEAAGHRRIQGTEHFLGDARATGGGRLISVLIPVKDGAAFLRELLPVVVGQSISTRLEIIAVDSGSQDDSLQILNEFGATVVSIDAAEFDHGLTRNLAAQEARGDVLVFLSQRALPIGDCWLARLIATLDGDPEVVGVCSRVVPRADADILTRRDVERELSGSAERHRKQITNWAEYQGLGEASRRAFLNFHTVSAAIRREAWQRTPFQSVKALGEDLLWAREALEAGWALVHEPSSIVAHSHAYSPGEVFSRNVDDGIANRDINGRTLDSAELLPHIRALVVDDWAYLREQLGPDSHELEHWQFEAMLRRVAQTVGQWVGVNYEKLPEGTAARFSGVPRLRQASGWTPASS